jgi:tetratricopeptide (TPR) repeat protein
MLAHALGRLPETLERGRAVLARDPLNAQVRTLLGWALDSSGRSDEAEEHLRRVTELNPDAPWGHAGIALTLLSRARYEEAVREAQQDSTDWARLTIQAMALWALGKRADSDAGLEELTRTFGEVAAVQIAQVHAYRGEKDRAFEWLDRAWRQRDPGLTWIKGDGIMGKLRDDPRWAAFLRKLGLADDQLE